MRFSRRGLTGATGMMLASSAASAAKPVRPSSTLKRIMLWSDGVPEPVPAGLKQQWIERSPTPATIKDRALIGVTAPFMDAYLPARPNGAALLIMPGGGYRRMAWDKEGIDIAHWYMARGVSCFVLAYRLPPEGWASGPDGPLADAQRAMRIIRRNAKSWGIDPERIAAMGFSAGGHLCANLAAQFERQAMPPRDTTDRLSARPCLAAPIYPAVIMEELEASIPEGGLFGKGTTAAQLAQHSPHKNIPPNAPPHVIVMAEDDPGLSPDHALALRAALLARKIPVETHLYHKGGHGFGIRLAKGLPAADWPQRVLSFGQSHGWA